MTATTQRYFRFEADHIQAQFIQALDRSGVAYSRATDGAVVFEEGNATEVMRVAQTVRDAQFSWYLLKWETEADSNRYRDVLSAAGLAFVVERHETGIWFLVKREDRAQHDELWERVLDKHGGP
jgi:hypothetical protein